MKIPFAKEKIEKKEIWAVVVPLEKWTKAATLLRDDFDKDLIVIDNIEDEDEDEEKLVTQITFFSNMKEYVRILVALDKAGINPITKEEEPEEKEEEKKEVKKKK